MGLWVAFVALAAAVVRVFGGVGCGSCCVRVGRRVAGPRAAKRTLTFPGRVDCRGSGCTDLGSVMTVSSAMRRDRVARYLQEGSGHRVGPAG